MLLTHVSSFLQPTAEAAVEEAPKTEEAAEEKKTEKKGGKPFAFFSKLRKVCQSTKFSFPPSDHDLCSPPRRRKLPQLTRSLRHPFLMRRQRRE